MNTNFGSSEYPAPLAALSSDGNHGKLKFQVVRVTEIAGNIRARVSHGKQKLGPILYNLREHNIPFAAVEIVLMPERGEEKWPNGSADYFDCFDYILHDSGDCSKGGSGGECGTLGLWMFGPRSHVSPNLT